MAGPIPDGVMAGLVPAIPIIPAPCLFIGIAGTSPATTRACGLKRLAIAVSREPGAM
jgi:hypothetical protein